MSASAPRRICFGPFEVDTQSGELLRESLKVNLPEQSFQVLMTLLERHGELVTREELQNKLWPGSTLVDVDRGLNKTINKLRAALGDDADNPRYVETLSQRGYRFSAPVAAQPVPGLGPQQPPRIDSLAVLPLANLSGDQEQEYFSDGMTEELICEIARIRPLRVISRTSVMLYKGSGKPLPEIARELRVDAVVEGTVARSGDRVRITAQLIHAPEDRHLWSGRYERDLRDILQLQAEVAQRHSGYQVGGTSPFGFRREGVPVYVQTSVLALPRLCINGGRRGFLVEIESKVLTEVLGATPVDCALPA